MKHSILLMLLCHIFVQTKDQSLLMFLHSQPTSFTDEEGLNVAHQMLTALMQKAAPVLTTQNLWQHIVLRQERFKQGLQDIRSVQRAVVTLHQDTNKAIKKNKNNIRQVDETLHHAWYEQAYPQLAGLDDDTLKHLLFDYFCYIFFEKTSDWHVYNLQQGYLLFARDKDRTSFLLDDAVKLSYKSLKKPTFRKKSKELSSTLQSYIKKNKDTEWTFYLTGHGYHKDSIYPEASLAGMSLHDFNRLLHTLNRADFKTKLLTYSSCYAAGAHSILAYQDKQGVDLKLSYPVIMMSLTDAPIYTFGLPAGLKLPPYDRGNSLQSNHVHNDQLAFYAKQDFKTFVRYAQRGLYNKDFVNSVNPYLSCSFYTCYAAKIENIPLIRSVYQTYFVPLDQSLVYSLTDPSLKATVIKNKEALLFYLKEFPGVIKLIEKIPAFVSMIPGSQVHKIGHIDAKGFDFVDLVASSFLSVDDMHDQSIYLCDRVKSSINISEISQKTLFQFDNVMILPIGRWLPAFAQEDASCYVYAEYQGQGYWIMFTSDKVIHSVTKLNTEQQDLAQRFKDLLLQQSLFGSSLSIKNLLSQQHFADKNLLYENLLQQCLQLKICKDS